MKHSKQEIIQNGQELFRANGYHATGISQILEASSIPKGTFYNYFSSKEDFAKECLLNYSQQIKKLIGTYMSFSTLRPDKRIRRYFDQLVKINQNEGADKGCLLMNLSTEIGGQSGEMAQLINQEFQEWIELLEPSIREAQNQGLINDQIGSQQLARMIYYTIYGGFSEMKNLRSTNRTAQQLDHLFRLIEA